MPTSAASRFAPELSARALGPDSRTVVVQDGFEVSAARLRRGASKLAEALRERGTRRAALATARADVAATALLAVGRSDRELMLLPAGARPSSEQLRAWEVDTLLDESLRPAPGAGAGAQPASCSVLLGTSGTSGAEPKIAVHLLETLLGRIRTPAAGASEPSWLLTYPPPTFAGVQVLLTALAGGGRLIAAARPDVSTLTRALLEHGATHVSGTPTFFRALVLALGDRGSPSLRQITLGGEAVDDPTLELLRGAFPQAAITHIYASTEAGALFAVRDGRAGFPARWLGEGVDGVRLRIRDGVLEVRSPRAMTGYVAGDSSPLGPEGWLVTGDLVEVEGKRVFFRGRADATINVGGAKVQPERVEAELLAIEGVHEVHVFGKPNPITGALVAARIVAAPGADEAELRRAIDELGQSRLAPHERPRILSFVGGIEMNRSGKKGRRHE